MANVLSLQIMPVAGKNPSLEELISAEQKKSAVEFAYSINGPPGQAGAFGLGPVGHVSTIKLEIIRLNPAAPGTRLLEALFRPVPGQSPIVVHGWYAANPVQGFLDLEKRP